MKNKIILLIFFTLITIKAVSTSKRGLAWPWNGVGDDFNLFKNSNKISWVYNWERWRPVGLDNTNFEYVATQRTAQDIEQLQNYMKGNRARILMVFNEPDIADQANISPDQAVKLWKQYVTPIKNNDQSLRLGSPGISNGASGIPWLRDFMSKCNDCEVDFISCHWYGPSYDHFVQHIQEVNKNFPDKRIWVTEFALQNNPSEDEQIAFLKQAMTFLDGQGYIERYSWFGAFRGSSGNNLIGSNGSLTNLGSTYIN